jgi:hypothetical protein
MSSITDCNKAFPTKLFILINTRIKGNQKIKYVPAMTLPRQSGSTVYFDPFVSLDKNIVDGVEIPQNYKALLESKKNESVTQVKNDEGYQKNVMKYQTFVKDKTMQQFFVKKEFDEMVKKAIKGGIEDLSEELDDLDDKIDTDRRNGKVNNGDLVYRNRILDKIAAVEKHNIKLTLETLFSKGNPFYLNGNKYSIFNYTWVNSSKIEKQNIQIVNRNPLFQQYSSRSATTTTTKNSLIIDYIYYLNYFWRKYYDSVDGEYPLYRNLDEFYKKENLKRGRRYTNSEWVDAKRILSNAPQNVKYAIVKRNMGIRRLYSDRHYNPRVTQDMFQKIIDLEAGNKLKLAAEVRIGGAMSTIDKYGSCYYVVIIDLEIFPKEKMTPLDEYHLNCDMKKIEIIKAYNELLGRKPPPPPLLAIEGVKGYRVSRRNPSIYKKGREYYDNNNETRRTRRRPAQTRARYTRRVPVAREVRQTRRVPVARRLRRGGESEREEDNSDYKIDS